MIIALLVIGFASIVTFGLDRYFKNQRGDFFILENGQSVTDFTFQTINSENSSLSDFKDKTVIIHFWASWCAPCVVEFPELVKLAKDNSDITILAFSSDRNAQSIAQFMTRYKIDPPPNFKIIYDKNQEVSQKYFSVFQLPESFILRPNLILDRHIVGAYADWESLF